MKKIDAAIPLSRTEISEEIKKFLLEDPEIAFPDRDLAAGQSLLSSGLIDSLAVLDIIAFLESRFDIQLDPEDLTGDNFDRISSMAALVRSRINCTDKSG